MWHVLRSEFRKLTTLRSLYIFLLIVVLMVGLDSVLSTRNIALDVEALPSDFLLSMVYSAITVVGTLAAIYVALMMSHEYRYNLIYHTLTTARSRGRSLLAKLVISTVAGSIFVLVAIATAVSGVYIGAALGGAALSVQDLDVWSAVLRSLIFVNGYTMIGLLLAVLFRNIVAPAVLLLLIPGGVELLLANLVDWVQAEYLPFGAIGQLMIQDASLEPTMAVAVFLLYLVPAWLVGGVLFLERDASS